MPGSARAARTIEMACAPMQWIRPSSAFENLVNCSSWVCRQPQPGLRGARLPHRPAAARPWREEPPAGPQYLPLHLGQRLRRLGHATCRPFPGRACRGWPMPPTVHLEKSLPRVAHSTCRPSRKELAAGSPCHSPSIPGRVLRRVGPGQTRRKREVGAGEVGVIGKWEGTRGGEMGAPPVRLRLTGGAIRNRQARLARRRPACRGRVDGRQWITGLKKLWSCPIKWCK